MAGTASSPIVVDDDSLSPLSHGGFSIPAPLVPSPSPIKLVKGWKKEKCKRMLDALDSPSDSESPAGQLAESSKVGPCKKQLFQQDDDDDHSDDDYSDIMDSDTGSDDEHVEISIYQAAHPETPIYEFPTLQYSVDDLISMLLDPRDRSLICTKRPTDIKVSATYLIDLDKLQHPDDAKRDNFGKWSQSGSHTVPFQAWYSEEGKLQVKHLQHGKHDAEIDVQYIRRLHYYHPSANDCKRMLAFITDSNGDVHHLCVASYRFPKGKVPQALPHGNSKSNTAFHPTWPSTMAKLKREATARGPKDTVNHVSGTSGGMIKPSGVGELPRNEHQVSNIKYSKKKQSSAVCNDDELFIAMIECKSKDITARFVRDVKAAPDPALVLANDQQMCDLVRFCTGSEEFSVVTVDPTFNLGDFDVTPITYQYLILETERSKNHPIFLGPILIHFRKNFSTYLYFASTVIGLQRDLEKLKAFGTDGETALVDAFSHEFGFAIHLSCALHLRRNIKQRLHSQRFPEEHIKVTLEEIFGASKGTVHLEGLIDCKSCEEFDNKLAMLKPVWDARESSNSTGTAEFYEWFVQYKSEILKATALYPVRVEAGLGNPPKLFTTNASESLNAVIKSKVNYEKSELGKFIDKMRCLVNDQQQEVERAVCRRGSTDFVLNTNF